MPKRDYPIIKVCGLTVPEQAKACAEMGADAIGLVFYPKSPRIERVRRTRKMYIQHKHQIRSILTTS